MARDIFVSHASDDQALAAQVCDLLEQRGMTCWIAPRNVSAGAVWDEAILDAIEQARAFVLILSPRANESSFVKNEVNRAFSDGKPIITFRTEDVQPGRSLQLYLARHHWMDAFPAPLEPRVEELAASIGKLLKPSAEDSSTVAAMPQPREGARLDLPPKSANAAASVGFSPRQFGWRTLVPTVLAASLAAALIGGFTVWKLRPSPRAQPVSRFTLTLPEGQQFSVTSRHLFAVSPDGGQMVYAANQQLYLRSMSQLEARPIPGTENTQGRGISSPVFSPDGLSIAFYSAADQTLKRIGVTGGAAVTLCKADSPFGMSWGQDGIVFGQGALGIMRVSSNGGAPETLVSVKAGEQAHGPQMLPDGRTVLFTLATGTAADCWDNAGIVAQPVKSSERKVLIEGGSDARYLPTGHLVYAQEGVLFAALFDPVRLEIAGGPVPVVEGVSRSNSAITGAAHLSVSATGTLIYRPGPVSRNATKMSLGFFDRQGAAEILKVLPGPYVLPRLSPDGRRIAFGSDDGKRATIWIYDLSGASAERRLTFDGQGNNRFPVWSADSQRVTFQSDREKDLGIFWQRADGAGAAERLATAGEGTSFIPEAWSPDGTRLLYNVTGADAKTSLWVLSLADKKAERFDTVESPATTLTGAVFSPDGKWVAYASRDGRARSAVYVQPVPPTGAKYQISKEADDGHHPVWSPDGTELFFHTRPGEPLHVVSISTQPAFDFGNEVAFPRTVFFKTMPPAVERPYDIGRDGRFLGLIDATQAAQPGGAAPPEQIQIVLNWFDELKRRVPVK